MSVDAIKWALDRAPVEGAFEALVLVAMADHADAYGVFYVRQSALRKRARCSERKVRDVIRNLEARGLIHQIRRRRQDGSERSSAYMLIGMDTREPIARPEDHPTLNEAHLAGELDWDAISRHDVPPVEEAVSAGATRPTLRHDVPLLNLT